MIVTTTPSVEGYRIVKYIGICFGETISTGFDTNSESGSHTRLTARCNALAELERTCTKYGANAVVGVDVDYEVLGQGNMLMVTASGTAVALEPLQ